MLFADLGLNAKRDIEQYRAADHGDIITDDESWPYVIECKRYGGKHHTFRPEWWIQVERAAQAAGKEPVLVYKYDRQPITVVMRLEHLMGDGAHHDEKVRMDWEAFIYVARENWNASSEGNNIT
jgi:hypothetical protein